MTASRPLTQRSAVTNGKTLIAGIDGRSAWMRRFRDLFEAHVADLGGEGEISEAERSIARRAATLAVECERMEAGFATVGAATPDELDLYGRTANSLRRDAAHGNAAIAIIGRVDVVFPLRIVELGNFTP